MPSIDRHAVGSRASDERLRLLSFVPCLSIVVLGAQALQIVGVPKAGLITTMSNDVVADLCRHDLAFESAVRAQRLALKLELPDPLPPSMRVGLREIALGPPYRRPFVHGWRTLLRASPVRPPWSCTYPPSTQGRERTSSGNAAAYGLS